MQRLFEEAKWVVKNGRVPWFPFWYKWIVYPTAVVLFYILWGYSWVLNKIYDWRSK